MSYHFTRRGAMLFNPRNIAVGRAVDVVVNLYKLTAECVLRVGNSICVTRVNNDTERVSVKASINRSVLLAKKRHIIAIVCIEKENFLFGVSKLKDFLKTLGGTNCITVGTLVSKDDDFVVFLNYLQGKCTEEYSEGIGYNLMNIYLNNRDKINRVEEYIAMMPAESQRVLYKGLCDKLFCEYAIEKTFNDTIDTRELYKIVPILGKHHSLTEEIAKECDIVLVNGLQ